jgi:hypothetical protein
VAAVDRSTRELGKGIQLRGSDATEEERRVVSPGRHLFTTPSQERVDAPGAIFVH